MRPRRPILRVLSLETEGLVSPDFCACCGAPAASSEVVRSGRKELLVPYCVRCLRHASAETTRELAVALSSCLLAASLALALPLAWPTASLLAHTLSVVAGAAAPLVLLALPRRPEVGHSSAGRAVWWLADGRLACTDARYAAALAAQTGSAAAAPRSRRTLPGWLLPGPLVAVLGAPSLWLFHHPVVRVLNLSDERLTVAVDGRAVLSLEPSSTENPTAGAEIRVPSGTHELTAKGPSGAVATARVTLESGGQHLFAPRSDAHCFWLEETRYGREPGRGSRVVPLRGESRFWVLPRQVDTWFSPNPAPASEDRRSSGGVLVALRQAPCSQAPEAARP